jgi:hypothetical protein
MNHTGQSSGDHLVLDIGGDTGALAIYAPPARAGREIEISPVSGPPRRTHNVVRPRRTGHGTRYAAVFPSLAAGSYTVWADDTTPAGTVTILGGQIAQFQLTVAGDLDVPIEYGSSD